MISRSWRPSGVPLASSWPGPGLGGGPLTRPRGPRFFSLASVQLRSLTRVPIAAGRRGAGRTGRRIPQTTGPNPRSGIARGEIPGPQRPFICPSPPHIHDIMTSHVSVTVRCDSRRAAGRRGRGGKGKKKWNAAGPSGGRNGRNHRQLPAVLRSRPTAADGPPKHAQGCKRGEREREIRRRGGHLPPPSTLPTRALHRHSPSPSLPLPAAQAEEEV